MQCPTTPPLSGNADLTGCGSYNVEGPDNEGLYDCLDCGLWFSYQEATRMSYTITEPDKLQRMTEAHDRLRSFHAGLHWRTGADQPRFDLVSAVITKLMDLEQRFGVQRFGRVMKDCG